MIDLKKVISISGVPLGVKKKKETMKGISQVKNPLTNSIVIKYPFVVI